MFNFTGAHLLECPNGRFTFVGRVSHKLCEIIPADKSAIMGQRWFIDENGDAMEAKTRVFDTADEALAFAADVDVEVVG